MKKLNLINKLIYLINNVAAILLLIGYTLPYISPKFASSFSVLSLTVPVLMILNLLFVIYWLVSLKKHFLLSLVCLAIGYFVSSPLYKFSNKTNQANNQISIMTYNVRLFNKFDWIKDRKIPSKINDFVKNENPDVLCIQEFHPSSPINYPYSYIHTAKENPHFGHAIYSKFKIINKGAFDFKNTSNNALFIDVVNGLDTMRIYNIHLESHRLDINKQNFDQKSSEKLLKRLRREFVKQQEQVEQIIAHKSKCRYPVILCGDFNNTAYSWTYNKLISNMKDSFIDVGTGFGKTFDLKHIPMRIDFIFADKAFIFTAHKNYNIKYSDHEPIMAKIGV